MLLGNSSFTSATSSSPFAKVTAPGTDKTCEKGKTISCLNRKLHSSYVRTIFRPPGKSSEPEGCVRLKNAITLSICIEESEDGILYS
ncbi:tRNA(Ile)-lysidine synthase [Bacillus pseudomycoides]|nr:tRNA(Ile)-lysidine synthase [Bacillus pseudomycoides]